MAQAGSKNNAPATRDRILLGFLGCRDSTAPLERTLPLSDDEQSGRSSTTLPSALQKRYVVRRVLGMGGFGVVLLAKDVVIGRLVAVKQLYRQEKLNPDVYRRLLQEARIAGQLVHPNIVSIHTVEEAEGDCCIVMEYLGGGNLGELIRASREPLPLETVANIILAVLEGLKTAHSMGVVHRDLKPENILFDNMGTPKITDFGLAHLPREAGGVDDPVATTVGTPLYIAPEQRADPARVDPRSDLYAAGLVLYEMLAGKRIYHLPELEDISDPDDLPVIVDILPWEALENAPPGMRDALQALLEKQPEKRFAAAADAIAALEPYGSRGVSNLSSMTGVLHAGAGYALSNLDILRDILELFLTDGILAPDERVELERRAERLGIDQAAATQLEEELRTERGLPPLAAVREYGSLVQEIVAVRDITEADREALNAKAAVLGIAEGEQQTIEAYSRGRPK